MSDQTTPLPPFVDLTSSRDTRFVALTVEPDDNHTRPRTMWVNPSRVVALGASGDATTWLLLAGAPRTQWTVRGTPTEVVALLEGDPE